MKSREKKTAFLIQLINWNYDSNLGHESQIAVIYLRLSVYEIQNNFKVKNIPKSYIPFYSVIF